MTRHPGPRRWTQLFAAFVPYALALVAAFAAVWGFAVIRSEFPEASLPQQFYATMAMFAGGYLSMSAPGAADAVTYDPQMPKGLAIPSIMAFSVTIATAGTVVVTLSTQARNAARAWWSRPDVVVIGSDATASAIISSCLVNDVRALLITDSRSSDAARTCAHRFPTVVIRSLSECGEYGAARRILGRCENIVVATDADPVNLEIQALVSERLPPDPNSRRSVIAVIGDAEMVDAMRPRRVEDLNDEDITCPAENVAEHVCLLIDAVATGPAAIEEIAPGSHRTRTLVDRVVVQIVDVDSEAGVDLSSELSNPAPTISLWIKRQCWSRSFLEGGRELPGQPRYNPIVPIHLQSLQDVVKPDDLLVRIYCGRSTSAVTSRYLRDRLRPCAGADAFLSIVVADEQVVATSARNFDQTIQVMTGREWLADDAPIPSNPVERLTLAVDPGLTGLDVHLVTDDVRLQWARMFNQTHGFMFAAEYTISGWLPGAPLGSATRTEEEKAVAECIAEGRRDFDSAVWKAQKRISDRLSSEKAVKKMIELLASDTKDAQWFLERYDAPTVDNPPPTPQFTDGDVRAVAEGEHDDWCDRSWQDTSRRGWRKGPVGMECKTYSRQQLGRFSFVTMENYADGKEAVPAELTDDPPLTPEDFRIFVNYNKRIVKETYPAIAARFGYQIVRADSLTDTADS